MTDTQLAERLRHPRPRRFDPAQVGWRIGVGHQPRSGELWCPWDRTAGVIGPQGSGKTLDLLAPALISAPGAAMVTLTKPDDLLLSLPERSKEDRPCVVLDPFRLVPGLRELVWDTGGLALLGVVGRQPGVALFSGVHCRHLPSQVLIPVPGGDLVQTHHAALTGPSTP